MQIVYFFLGAAAAGSWWLSGFDTRITGENKRTDFIRRIIRCAISLVMVGLAAITLFYGGMPGAWMYLTIVISLAVIWAGCLAELSARMFQHLFDPADDRAPDVNQTSRELDRLGQLITKGNYVEAIQLSKNLKESPECSTLAIDTVLFRLYDEMLTRNPDQTSPALMKFRQLRDEKRYDDAAIHLKSHLAKHPRDPAAVFALLNLYALDLNQPATALSALEEMEARSKTPPGFANYARQWIQKSNSAESRRKETVDNIESLLVTHQPRKQDASAIAIEPASVDELLAAGHLATAIEILERSIADAPDRFDLQLKLAEAHGAFCRNHHRARKIVESIQSNPAFSPAQVKLAQARLAEWR